MAHTRRPLGPYLRIVLLGAALGVAGCGANLSPVLNVSHAPVVGVPPGTDPAVFVHESIIRAIANKGWTVASDAPGVVTASIQKDELKATVDVTYTATDYSIMYKSSSPSLKFDGTRIHKRYNFWVDRLRAQINAELQKPRAVTPPATPS
jgi:hypothetical protein